MRSPVRPLLPAFVCNPEDKEFDMTKGHKSGRKELKPSLVGHKAPARRLEDDSAVADERGQAGNAPEVGQDVDCFLPDSDLVRDATPREKGSGDIGKTGGRRAHKVRGGPDR
jgi:hypothetical protein